MIKRVILVISMLCSLVVLVSVPPKASAEVQTVEADGYYIIGDGPDENHSMAKKRARLDAKRIAAEKTGVFVEGLSIVKNGKLTRDEILTITAQILKIESEKITPEVIGDTIRYRCHIVAKVDSSNITEELLSNRTKLRTAVQDNTQLMLELYKNHQLPYTGLSAFDKAGAERYGYQLNIDKGVYVFQITKNSPASKAGIERGDILLKVNGEEVNSIPELRNIILQYRIGDILDIEVDRNGSIKILYMTLEGFPE